MLFSRLPIAKKAMRRGSKRRYQPKDHLPRVLAAKAAPELRQAFKEAFRHARALVPVARVAALLKGGNRVAAIKAIDLDHLREVYKEAFAAIGRTVETAAEAGAAQITKAFDAKGVTLRYGRFKNPRRRLSGSSLVVRKDVGDTFAFDRFDKNTQALIRKYQDELIMELGDQARASIEQAVMSGVHLGLGSDQIASAIRDSISLTERQTAAVENFRSLLEAGDPAALSRALRDTEFDNVVQDLIDGEDVSSEVIDQMVDRYAENYLDYRAQTIADTESSRAANIGLHESYLQAVDRGAIPEDAVKRIWELDLDERTCEICLSIQDMNDENGIGLNDMFESIDGPIENPPAHVNCRCSCAFETDLDAVRAAEDQEA